MAENAFKNYGNDGVLASLPSVDGYSRAVATMHMEDGGVQILDVNGTILIDISDSGVVTQRGHAVIFDSAVFEEIKDYLEHFEGH